jgi:hypothetical protein
VSLGFLLRLQLLDLAALALDFALLLIDLTLGLGLLSLLVLHLVTHGEPADAAQRAANCSASTGCAHCGTDYRAGSRTEAASYQSALFPRAQRLTAASSCPDQHRQAEQTDSDTLPRPEHVNLPEGASVLIKWNQSANLTHCRAAAH